MMVVGEGEVVVGAEAVAIEMIVIAGQARRKHKAPGPNSLKKCLWLRLLF